MRDHLYGATVYREQHTAVCMHCNENYVLVAYATSVPVFTPALGMKQQMQGCEEPEQKVDVSNVNAKTCVTRYC